jgi:hypothetical protein
MSDVALGLLSTQFSEDYYRQNLATIGAWAEQVSSQISMFQVEESDQGDIPASTTRRMSSVLVAGPGPLSAQLGQIIPWNSSLIALGVTISTPGAAGSLFFGITQNGSFISDWTELELANGKSGAYQTYDPHKIALGAGSIVDIRIRSTGAWNGAAGSTVRAVAYFVRT